MNRLFAIVLFVCAAGSSALGQDAGRIVSAGPEVLRMATPGGEERPLSGLLEDGDQVRTFGTSVAALALDDRIRITLDVESQIRILSLEEPAIELSGGRVWVRTEGRPVRVVTPAGQIVLAEPPAEAEVELLGEQVGIRVLGGGVTTLDMASGRAVFRGPVGRRARVYGAGRIEGFAPAPPAPYAPPTIYLGDPWGVELPAGSPEGADPAANPGPPPPPAPR